MQCISATAPKLKEIDEKAEASKDAGSKSAVPDAEKAEKDDAAGKAAPGDKSKEASKDGAGAKDAAGAAATGAAAPGAVDAAGGAAAEEAVEPAPTITMSDDLAHRAAIYGVLFQVIKSAECIST